MGDTAKNFTLNAPPKGRVSKVYGNVIYSVKTKICSAAVHDGRITALHGGFVSIHILPPENEYIAVNRNGVIGSKWGSTRRSAFEFI